MLRDKLNIHLVFFKYTQIIKRCLAKWQCLQGKVLTQIASSHNNTQIGQEQLRQSSNSIVSLRFSQITGRIIACTERTS